MSYRIDSIAAMRWRHRTQDADRTGRAWGRGTGWDPAAIRMLAHRDPDTRVPYRTLEHGTPTGPLYSCTLLAELES
jgi:hypothetical protein